MQGVSRIFLGMTLLTVSIGVPVESAAEDWQAQMFEAAVAGDWDKLNEAIANGANPRGRDLVHWAAGEGHIADLQRFIEEGVDIDVKDDMGWTPLALAAFAGRPESVKLLITNGAALGVPDKEQNTPLHLALTSGHKRVAEILLEQGAELEARNVKGRTPLFSAATNYRNPEIVAWLLGRGADAGVTDLDGLSPLDLAHKRHSMAVEMAEDNQPIPEWIETRMKGYARVVQILEN